MADDRDIQVEMRAFRARFGLSQGGAADVIGVSRHTLRGWERGIPCGMPELMRRYLALLSVALTQQGSPPP